MLRTKNKGFTLIEMVVTVTVLAVVLGLTVSGIISWQDWANFKKENEYAQTLFVAAQNQLTEYAADGRLDAMQKDFGEDEDSYVVGSNYYTKIGLNLTESMGSLVGEDGLPYSLDKLFPASSGKKNAKLYQDEIVSLRAQAGDYQQYLDNPSGLRASKPEAYWLFELLGAYVYDTSILNGGDDGSVAICVEFTPGNGQVFSVLYSDRKDRFVYSGINGESESGGAVDITNRVEDYRHTRMVGYYGVDTLYAATSNTVVQPSIASVKLHNKDTFYMTFKLTSKYSSLTTELDYVMDLDASKNINDKKITVTLPARTESGVPTLKNEANAQKVDCKVSRYEKGADGKLAEKEIGTFPMLAWVEKDNSVHVVWDAADIQATTNLYENELSDIRNNDKVGKTKFSKTYSFFRFGVDADNVYASVMAKGEGYTNSKITSNFGNINFLKNQTEKHTCFANEKTNSASDGKDFTYSITNARHLFNVRYIEDLSYEKEAGSTEAAKQIKTVTFIMKADLDWDKFQADGQLFNSTGAVNLASLNNKVSDGKGGTVQTVTTANCDFPSIKQIRNRDVFDGNDKKISGVATSEISNALYGLYFGTGASANKLASIRPTAFVNVNYGQINDLTMDKVTAAGSDMVGGICAINAGSVKELETQNTNDESVISGKKNVGGIIGFQMPTTSDLKVEKLVNRAAVQGTEAVGGILGMVRNNFNNINLNELTGLSTTTKHLLSNAKNLSITINECQNYGPVEGVNSNELKGVYQADSLPKANDDKKKPEDADRYEARYIGGIVGYSFNTDKDNTARIKIEDCESSPQYEQGVLGTILSSDTMLEKKLNGAYIGGIVGYNHYGEINECSAQAQKGQEGYLFGYRYVGGIVGFNIGPSGGVLGSETDKQGVNENHVIAYEYAGGITGANASVSDVDTYGKPIAASGMDPERLDGLMIPSMDVSMKVKVDNWINKGVVIATNAYAGGITGYNTGWIYRCNSVVDSTTADTYFAKLHSGDYAGGVAGYNNGVIGNTERNTTTRKKTGENGDQFATTCYVRGRDYVGGIVGYNDTDAIVEDYQVAGGYIVGDTGSHFVGGYAGFNSAIDLLMDTETQKERNIFSNPNRVEGTYFVGGNIGGNVINTNGYVDAEHKTTGASEGDESKLVAVFKTDNFLGTMSGNAFVGGFMGYNLLIDDVDPKGAESDLTKRVVFSVQKELIQKFNDSDATEDSVEQKLHDKVEIVENLATATGVKFTPATKTMLYMKGQGANVTKSAFGTITADIYVGGVLGFNDEQTVLEIHNVENASSIVALKAIQRDLEQVDANNKTRTTNYLGDDFTYTYSYAGGVIGKVSRKTTLDNCYNTYSGTVSTKGTYTGGLCEVNEGKVIHCKVSGFGSGVDDYLGGLCGLNKQLGTIEDCTFKNKTVSGRNVVGGIAAENFGTIKNITLQNAKMQVAGLSTGSRDGVTGTYVGVNGETGTIELEADLKNVSVKSDGRFAGAVAGVNEGAIRNKVSSAANIDNNLEITGNIEGTYDVGALIGLNRDKNAAHKVANYTNKATVIALNGNAGGIIGENASTNAIQYCVNDAVVSATVGNAGGITSTNSGEIKKCYDYKSVSAPKGMCGGITAVNGTAKIDTAIIEECYVGPKSDLVANIVFTSTQSVGGVTAWNYGIIEKNRVEKITVTNIGEILRTSIGVMVGDNKSSGKIYLPGNTRAVTDCIASVKTNNCNVGGVAGTNAGLIANKKAYEAGAVTSEGYALVGVQLKMDGAKYASLGGIAGNNTGTIAYCQVDGDMEGLLGTAKTGYGGVVGFSGFSTAAEYAKAKGNTNYRAKIIGCTYDGNIHIVGSAGNPGNAGGITGINGYGSFISGCAIGVREQDLDGNASLTTTIIAGDASKTVKDPDKSSYAYVGGIAGRNYGDITDIDMKAMSKDTKIHILSFAGSTGGMVGYQYAGATTTGYKDKDGVEHWLTTPDSMTVEMRLGENDYGVGGVIGYDRSSEPVSYIRNYAHVENMVVMNVKTGGVIGTLELYNVPYVDVSHLENYGYVKGHMQVGGIIGRTKYCSVQMSECVNYGDVYSAAGSAGGLIARIYDIRDSEAFFTKCDNHGNITVDKVTYVGGILGFFDSSYSVRCYFYDCDNTGIIKCTKSSTVANNAGHILGNGTTATTYMELCQNYNTYPLANGMVGNAGVVHLKDCLDNGGNKSTSLMFNPFLSGDVSHPGTNGTTNSSAKNVYYLDRSNTEREAFTEDAGAYFTIDRTTNYNFYWCANNFKTVRRPNLFLTAPTNLTYMHQDNKKKIDFHIAYDKTKCSGLKAFNVYMWSGKMNKATFPISITYKLSAEFTDKNGKTATANGTLTSLTGDLDHDKIVLTKPAGLADEIVDIRLYSEVSSGNVYYRGFTYTPAGATKEAECTSLGQKNDTTFTFASTSNGTVKNPATKGSVHSMNNIEDVLGFNYDKYDFIQIDRVDASSTLDLDFDVINGENASGMKSFVFYPSNNNTNATTASKDIRTYVYDCTVTFVDKNGDQRSVTYSRSKGNPIEGLDSSKADYKKPVEIPVPDGLNKVIEHVTLSFTYSEYYTTDAAKPTKNQNNFFFRGFGWVPAGCDTIEYLCFDKRPEAAEDDYYKPVDVHKLLCDYTNRGDADIPYVYCEDDHDLGFKMDANNPIKDVYYADDKVYNESKAKADGSDSRIRVYEDLHPKFIKMIREQRTSRQKLATPVATAIDGNGKFVLSWNPVPGAYEYEVKYEIHDENNKVVEKSEIHTQGTGNTKYYVPIQSGWKGYSAVFYVRAVNGYRYTGNDSNIYRYDSDWGIAKTAVKIVLPQPVVHLELTSGNKMVAILDNREKYKLANGSYMDCNVEVSYTSKAGTEIIFNIPVADGFASKNAEYLTGFAISDDHNLVATAKPVEDKTDLYSESTLFYSRGHIVDNDTLRTRAQYVATNFNGFYGTNSDNMTYDVYFTTQNADSFVKSDIVSFDEELGLNVSYSSMMTHVACTSGTAYFTATLSDLPSKWFAEDFSSPIVAREYLDASQYRIIHYGHTVAEDIYLDKTTRDENIAILKGIVDPYYLGDGDTDVVVLNSSIWDDANDCLKSGYTLQRKQDDYGNSIYDIFYNASIELSEASAKEANATLAAGTTEYVYYNYCVDYKLYTAKTASSATVDGKNVLKVHNKESDPSAVDDVTAAQVNTDDYQESMLVCNYKDSTQTAGDFPTGTSNLKIQEMQPAPIIDQDFEDTKVDGHRAFTFTFDEFFKDTYCLYKSVTPNANAYYSGAEDQYMTRADGDVATTWEAFLQKSDYASQTDIARKRRMMNAYYYSYVNAKYKVELIGTTLDGKEAVIDTLDVVSPQQISTITPDEYNGLNSENATVKVNTKYERYNYKAQFVDRDNIWNNYSNFRVRVIHLGLQNSITTGTSVSDISKVSGYNASTFVLPRYSEYEIHVKMKLNTINNPSASLHQDAGGFVTDNLLYDVSFGAITNADQLKDLGGYLICAKVKDPEDSSTAAKPHYYYVTEIAAESQPDVIGSGVSGLDPSENVIAEIDKATNYIVNGNARTALIDLSDFNTSDDVEITVQAVARSKAVNFEDGDIGSPTEITILERLKVPNVDKLLIDATKGMDAAGTYIDMDTYNKGMYFKYDSLDPSYAGSDYDNVKIEMAAAVYDACGDTSDVNQYPAGDEGTGSWNDGAIATLKTKADPMDLAYVRDGNASGLNLTEFEAYPGQYAGKWLKLALHATSVSRINSQWTDQDLDEKNTIDYRWIQIPTVQLADANIETEEAGGTSEVTDVVRYFDMQTHQMKDDDTKATDVSVASQTLHFAEDRNNSGYRIALVSMKDALDKQTLYNIYLERHEDALLHEFDGTWDVSVGVGDAAAALVGNIGKSILDDTVPANELVELSDIFRNLNIAGTDYDVKAQLRYVSGTEGGTFQLVLPDITSIGDTDLRNQKDYAATSEAIVMPYLASGITMYKAGNGSMFKRDALDASNCYPFSITINYTEEMLASWEGDLALAPPPLEEVNASKDDEEDTKAEPADDLTQQEESKLP